MLSVTTYFLLAFTHVLWSTTGTSAWRSLLRNFAYPGSLCLLSPQPVKQFHANRSLKLWTTFWNKYERGKLHSILDSVVLKKQNQVLIKVHNLFKMASDEVLFSLIWSYLAMEFLKMLGCCVKLYWRWRVPDNIVFGPGDTSYGGLYIWKALPERRTFFRLNISKRVGISWVEVYERVGKIIIKVFIRVVFLNTSMHLIATKNDRKTYC